MHIHPEYGLPSPTPRVGIIAFSFGQRPVICEAYPYQGLSNKDLAKECQRLKEKYSPDTIVLVAAQREVVYSTIDLQVFSSLVKEALIRWSIKYHPPQGLGIHFIINQHRQKGAYLDSEEVMAQAAKFFKQLRIERIIVVAQPFLHLHRCKKLAKKYGFEVIEEKIGKIRFDKNSTQPWTRSRIKLLIYALRQILFGHKDA